MKKIRNILWILIFCMFIGVNVTEIQAETITKNISVNSSVSGKTESYSATQYRFNLQSPGKVNITFTHDNLSTTNECWNITIYNSNNENLMEMKSVGTATNETSTDVGLPAGEYYVEVYTLFGGGDKNYTLKVNYSTSNTWEKEGNDGYGEATAISVNTSYNGAIQHYDDEDYYMFTLPSDGKIAINFQHPLLHDSYTYWRAEIYNTEIEQLVSLEVKGTETNKNSAELGLSSGTYYLKIVPSSRDYSTYILKLNYEKSNNWEKESNGGYGTATPVSLNTEYSGAIQHYNDEDYYKFIIPSAGKIGINFQHSLLHDAYTYWKVDVYNEKLECLCQLESNGTEINENSAELGLNSGTYYIKVSPSSRNYSTYKLKLNYSISNVWEKESNDGYASATPIQLNTQYYGAIQHYYDEDFYTLSLPSSNKIKMIFSHNKLNDNYEYWYVQLYNSQLNRLEKIYVKGADTYISSNAITLSAGTYYIKVSPSSRSIQTYGLKISNVVEQPSVQTPSKPQMASVKAGKRKATIKWKKVSGALGYEVYMSTKKTKGYKKIKTVTTASKVKYVKSGLKKKKTYYFKVRAFTKLNGKKIYGSYSAPKKVRVK